MPRQARPTARASSFSASGQFSDPADGGDAMVGQHPAHAFGRTFRPARHQHALARALQRLQMIRRGLEDIEIAAGAFGREIAALPPAGIHAGLAFGRLERREIAHQMPGERRLPFAIAQIQRVRLQRLIRRRLDLVLAVRVAELAAGVVTFAHQFQPRRLGLLDLMPQHHQAARQIVEQRVEAVIEKRQPMLHALRLAAGADAFIKRIVARRARRPRHSRRGSG